MAERGATHHRGGRGMSTAANGSASAEQATAERLLSEGFRPVVLYPAGYSHKDGKRVGKEPYGKGWGLKSLDYPTLVADFDYFRRGGHSAGVGLCLGPGRAPGGRWLIDVEGDGPKAEDSLATLLGGEEVPTRGWDSARGKHRL